MLRVWGLEFVVRVDVGLGLIEGGVGVSQVDEGSGILGHGIVGSCRSVFCFLRWGIARGQSDLC